MGFFSWMTADTNESIANVYVENGTRTKPVFLLQPNGQKSIKEDTYEGYGEFNGVDSYVWLAKNNLSADIIDNLSDDDLRDIGISMELGDYYEDVDTNEKFAYMPNKFFNDLISFDGNYGEIMKQYNKTPNDLIKEKQWVTKSINGNIINITKPLKFSFNENAVYEDLDKSDTCPEQGYFYH